MESISRTDKIIQLCSHALQYYDERLVDHGVRVSYIASHINKYLPSDRKVDSQNLILLSLFHDIGAYKTEEIDRMVQFETEDVDSHSVYGYLFLKYLSPLSKLSKAILYHHSSFEALDNLDPTIRSYAQLIHLADRIDIALLNEISLVTLEKTLRDTNLFYPDFIDSFITAYINDEFLHNDWSTSVTEWLTSEMNNFDIDIKVANKYLEMVIYSIDFKSEVTVHHSVNTTTISLYLGSLLDLNELEMERLYYAALTHDIGKIAINADILEHPGRLSDSQMKEMREHVAFTRKILTGILDKEIVEIACRHHEKLDGSGYPLGLTSSMLSVSDRILAIADITSALIISRSYKGAYSWRRTLSILNDFAKNNLLDAQIVDLIVKNYSDIDDAIKDEMLVVLEKYRTIQLRYVQLKEVLV